MGGTQVS